MTSVAVIGAGAAGCFCAVEIKRRHPDYKVTVLESTKTPMAKLCLTGGGRCNITNTFEYVDALHRVYPRGERLMKKLFYTFGPDDTKRWWEDHGLSLHTEDTARVFPDCQDARQVAALLERLMKESGVILECGKKVERIRETLEIVLCDGSVRQFDRIVLTIGGTADSKLREMLPEGVELAGTAASLFTFKIQSESLRDLMGSSVPGAELSIPGTNFHSSGALLVTDWGFSGPATLRLSSYAAPYLFEKQYDSPLQINWLGISQEETMEMLKGLAMEHPGKQLSSVHPRSLSERIWKYLLVRSGVDAVQKWNSIGSKALSKLCNTLCCDIYRIQGRAKFKDEFVTCGGVALSGIKTDTLESKACPGLFFAGEVLDVDAVTGGFNLQAAWTTGYIAARLGEK